MPCRCHALQLGTPFAITLEAPHVVDMRRQVWAGVVGTGPGGTLLNVGDGRLVAGCCTRLRPPLLLPLRLFASRLLASF